MLINLGFYFNDYTSKFFLSSILSTHNATLSLTGIAFVWEFITIIDVILPEVQYIHNDDIHFLTYSTIKELASCDFLNSLIKIVSKNGSIAFFKA